MDTNVERRNICGEAGVSISFAISMRDATHSK